MTRRKLSHLLQRSKTNKQQLQQRKAKLRKLQQGKSKLNIKKLEDGVYSISGKMLKTDKKTESMANEAINHKIKLTVKNGKYDIILDFKGLNISSSYGYLSKIKYFTNTYKIDQYKVPTGSLKNVTVDSYQKDTKGKKVRDSYGSDYPDQVTFPLISKAKMTDMCHYKCLFRLWMRSVREVVHRRYI